MTTQICTKCNEEKPVDDYTDGRNHCKECRNEQRKRYYLANKETILQASRQYKKEIRDINRVKIECDCGSKIYRYNLDSHIESKKHKNFLITGSGKEKKELITYYDESNNYKKVFLRVDLETLQSFKYNRANERTTNYKVLKDMNII